MNQTEINNRSKYLEKLNELIDVYHILNSYECDFISDIQDKLGDEDCFLTEKQVEKLEEIYEKYC